MKRGREILELSGIFICKCRHLGLINSLILPTSLCTSNIFTLETINEFGFWL